MAVTRSFGLLEWEELGVIWLPEISQTKLLESDRFVLLGTDGLWKVLTNQICVAIISQFYKPELS